MYAELYEEKRKERRGRNMRIENERMDRTFETLSYSMGEDILRYMQDHDVFEIIQNPDGTLWIDTFSKGKVCIGERDPASSKQIIYNVAAISGQVVAPEFPILEAEVPASDLFDGFRFNGLLPGIVTAPSFNIRKHPKRVLTLDEYVTQGVMSEHQKEIILKEIHAKKNIIVAGSTGSGKTTFVNAILAEISTLSDRIVMIEDTKELNCLAKDYVSLKTMKGVNMVALLRTTLRMSPNRIVVGEIRNEEALTLLDAWSTGHRGGCSTVHSDSAYDTLLRLETLTSRAAVNPQQITIGRAVDVVVYLEYTGLKRKVKEIIRVKGYDPLKQAYQVEVVE